MITFADLIDHVLAYSGTDATRASSQNQRRAVLNAYTLLPTVHEWCYYLDILRIATSASYNTGSLVYDHTGGASERMLTLTGGTWPSWAALGSIRINDIPYVVSSRQSDTVLILSAESNPGADLTSAEGRWILFRDTYSLPENFVGGDEIVTNENGGVLHFVHPRDWAGSRRVQTGPGRPVVYTYTGDRTTYNRQVIRLWPPSDAVYSLDMLYRRKPRAMVFDYVTDGTVSIASGDNTLTGVGTRFRSDHVGCVVRLALDATEPPTGYKGLNPYIFETTIASYTSGTSVELTDAPTADFSGVAYVISDPCDIETATHEVYLLRECERQMRMVARMDTKRDEAIEYDLALERARETDAKNTSQRAEMRWQAGRSGLRYFPRGADA